MIRRLMAAATGALLMAGAAAAQTSAPTPTLPAVPAKPAPATVDADPALWVVKDKETTIYLFGTIHVLKPGLRWFDEAVKTAFDSSDELVLEMVQPDTATMQKIVIGKAMNIAGPKLPDQLPQRDQVRYMNVLSYMGLPLNSFDHARPWFAATNLSILPLLKLGYDPASGPESVLTKAAADEKKPVEGLETAEQQIGYLADLSQSTQIQFLESTLKDLPKTAATMDGMVDAWSKGDPARLGEYLNEDLTDSPELAKTLLYDRNARWAQWIKARLAKPGTVFIAVGAGHLAGAKSVIEQLKALGLRANRVAY